MIAGLITCWSISMFETIKSFIKTGDFTIISGHQYLEVTNGVLECQRCGHISIDGVK